LRLLVGFFEKPATRLAPRVTRTASGFHSVNALTGDADHARQESQWQYPIATGAPVTVNSTAPQKHSPWNVPAAS
jgi:hypothetical protein